MSVVDGIMALQKCPCLNTRNLWMLQVKRYFADVIKEHEMVKLFCIIWIGLYNHKGPYKRERGGAELERGRGIRETQRLEWYKEGDTSQGNNSWGPMDYSPPGSSVHGLFQARILEWIATSSSRGSSWPTDQTCISYIVDGFFTTEPLEKFKSRWLLVPKYCVTQSTLTQPQLSNPTIIGQPLANPICRSCLLGRMVQPSN